MQGLSHGALAASWPLSGGRRASSRASRASQAVALSQRAQRSTAHRPHDPAAAGLDQPASVATSQQLDFERRGFCVLRGLLAAADVEQLRSEVEAGVAAGRLQALRQRIRVLCPGIDPGQVASEAAALHTLADHSSDKLGFLQVFNLWRSRSPVRALATSARLASTAAALLGTRKLRLYQDCVFLKEPGFGATNWHSDLRMAPFDTNDFVTAWLPLRRIAGGDEAGDSGLLFASGSHRDFALPFWYDLEGRDLGDRGYPLASTGAMEVGDVSFHHGWTLHCAAPQPPGTPPRMALAVSFFRDGARLLPQPKQPRSRAARSLKPGMLHGEDAESYSAWLPDLRGGAKAAHALLPLVWPSPPPAG